jgi:hypothetical protein
VKIENEEKILRPDSQREPDFESDERNREGLSG